jgi:hypothetical protein
MIQKVGFEFYKLDMELEKILRASFPNPGDGSKIRQLFAEDVKNDTLGVGCYYRGNVIHFTFPIAIVVGQR